ncbi:MAG: hypothetical protein GY755_03160 [Chloroflexi bacterium]|nr:hypothetical protein [Chloroflexota bacterium]
MKRASFAVKGFNILGFICAPATLVLAILWFLQPEKNYEPITVALGSLSVIFFAIAQVVQRKYSLNESKQKRFDKLSADELLEVIEKSSLNDWDVSFAEDGKFAVFKNSPLLRIETRYVDEFVHNDDFYEKWANRFPDSHASSAYYHVYYGATRLKEFVLVSVDGGRALLPLPKYAMDLSVEPVRYKVALIFDQLGSCDEYMKRAGLFVE